MGTNILDKINSLNTRSFNDYQFLIKEIRLVVESSNPKNLKEKIKTNDELEDYFFEEKTYDYVIDNYNQKLDLFYENFFSSDKDELIREVIKINPKILEEVDMATIFYFSGLYKNSLTPTLGPDNVSKTISRNQLWRARYEGGYYLNPKFMPKKDEGCFIATYAYEKYDHPKVLILREFRDNKLTQSIMGRCFIKGYYFISPKFVTLLEKTKVPKSLVRKLILPFVFFINKKLQ